MIRVHHLNCVTACPLGGGLMDGASHGLRGRLATHCLLVEHPVAGLVLVDTGYGMRDVTRSQRRMTRLMSAFAPPEARPEMTAIRQVQALGYHAHDVRHVILSHLDYDHAGGLDDFPEARIHVSSEEVLAASAPKRFLDRQRYRHAQWASRDRWWTHDASSGAAWLGFEHVRAIPGVQDILVVPLAGHTPGHCGVAIETRQGWLFYVGDAYFHHDELAAEPSCPPGLRMFQRAMEWDREQRLANLERIRDVHRALGDRVTVFCAHDVGEMEALSGRSHREPVPHVVSAPRDAAEMPNPGDPGPAMPEPREPTMPVDDPRLPGPLPPALGR